MPAVFFHYQVTPVRIVIHRIHSVKIKKQLLSPNSINT
jgi:hypothetical protein